MFLNFSLTSFRASMERIQANTSSTWVNVAAHFYYYLAVYVVHRGRSLVFVLHTMSFLLLSLDRIPWCCFWILTKLPSYLLLHYIWKILKSYLTLMKAIFPSCLMNNYKSIRESYIQPKKGLFLKLDEFHVCRTVACQCFKGWISDYN